ncbi:YcxB family protein [Leptolyngbya sp. FACHB-261]|uniref:YcxB family protein n=1 Tax=Leptolyngbya sp. FACHB-261 TaxID=2692806 RepID=UPI001689B032|nr:YcxB family protein [Leptolyngbya sp. FACHB-261]MBD2103562.1 hypothetical protein [Leptolyngbya sp. FACHB-261]
MHIQLTYTPEDFYQANLLHWRRKPLARLFPILGAVALLLAGSDFYLSPTFLGRDILLSAIGFYLLLYTSVFLRLFATLGFRDQRALRQPLNLDIDEEQVQVSGQTLQGQTAWSQYQKAIWNQAVLLLYPTPEIFQIVPRRALAADQDWRELLTLTASKVAQSQGPDPSTV